jgi:hypothetical protein
MRDDLRECRWAIIVTPDASYTTFPWYDEGFGVLSTATCPANTVVARMGGDTFLGGGVPWASTVALACRPLTFSPAGEIRVNNAAATTTTVVAGADENNNGSAFAGYFCGSASGNTLSNVMVRGYRPQDGGEGIDGINVSCGAVGVDYGDAPASYGSANHEITPATFLGVEVDAEAQQQPSALANGDDTAGGTAPNQSIDDEDGVGSFPPILAGITNSVSVNVAVTNRNPTLPATLVGWIDFNQNGTFGAAEGVSVLIPPLTGTTTVTLTWTGVAAQTVGTSGGTFARFRIADGTALTTSTPTGAGVTGEVEDYRVLITAQAPAITMLKSAPPSDAASFTVGQTITYSFVVTNTGNVTLTNVTVNEGTFTGSGTMSAPTCPDGAASLAPGAQVTCTATYVVTQADVDAGSISNTATTTGTPPSGPPPVSPPSTSTVTAKPASAWVSRSAPRRRSPGSRSSRHQQGQQGKAGMAGQGGWPRPGRAASRSLSTPV